MYINLEEKTLSELLELRRIFSGTNRYCAIDRMFKLMASDQYNRMLAHTKQRSVGKVKKFNLYR